MSHFCPHCGANLTPDQVVTRGKWELHVDRVFYDGLPLKMMPGEANILHTLASAGGRTVSYWALGGRSGNAQFPDKVAHTRVSQMRSRYGRARLPIEAVRGLGYRWRDDP